MLVVRKIDWYAQVIIIIATVVCFPLLLYCGFLAGLFVLGAIQILSAAINTATFIKKGFRNTIIRYWLFVVYDFCILFSAAYWGGRIGQIVVVVLLIAAAGVAVYYLQIYKKLINNIELRNELAGFIKL